MNKTPASPMTRELQVTEDPPRFRLGPLEAIYMGFLFLLAALLGAMLGMLGTALSATALDAVVSDRPCFVAEDEKDPPPPPPPTRSHLRAFDSCVETVNGVHCVSADMPMFRMPLDHGTP